MKYVLIIIAQLTILAAAAFLYEGQSYLTSGYGLHPLLAGPIALSLLLLPYCFAAWVMRNRNTLSEQERTTRDWLRLHPLPKEK